MLLAGIKKKIKPFINYKFFINLAILFKYNFSLYNKLIKKKYKYELNYLDQLKNNSVIKLHVKDIFDIKIFNEFQEDILSKLDKIRNDEKTERVIMKSDQTLKTDFMQSFLKEDKIKTICDSYFKYEYSLKTCEVWWGRPNYDSSGYVKFHFDRNHLRALHFDLNLIDMFEESGAVEIINKQSSKRFISTLWGGEFSDISKDDLKDLNINLVDGQGEKGTLICYVSMNLLHRGGLCTKSERLILHIVINEEVYWRKENTQINYRLWVKIF